MRISWISSIPDANHIDKFVRHAIINSCPIDISIKELGDDLLQKVTITVPIYFFGESFTLPVDVVLEND